MPKPVYRDAVFYLVWLPKVAGPVILEAYSPGQAVECFLAMHGLFGYNEPIRLLKLQDGFMQTRREVNGAVGKDKCAELDKFHSWELVDEL